jgi:hypothetical protein
MIPNINLIFPLMIELEKQYDPLTDFVVRGNCIVHGLSYPQGGVGTIISRFAFKTMSDKMEAMLPILPLGTLSGYDDMLFGAMIKKLNISVAETQSTAFLGYRFDGPGEPAMRTGNFSGLPPCPVRLDQEGCRRYFAPVRDIVFHHDGTDGPRSLDFEEELEMMRNLWNAPPDVQWYVAEFHEGYIPRMCRRTPPAPGKGRFVKP